MGHGPQPLVPLDDDGPRDPDPTHTIPIAEQFESIQGEGPTAGEPSIFLRTAGCNLLCGNPENPGAPQADLEPNGESGATWVCDTIEVFRNPEQFPTPDELYDAWRDRGWIRKLGDGHHLILTGGEPTLHDGPLAAFCSRLRSGPNPWIEIETNGTRIPDRLAGYIDQFNVSPKLANSGMPTDRRLNRDALEWFADDDRAVFKFVVSRRTDAREIKTLCSEIEIDPRQVMLMPAGATQAEQAESQSVVADLCTDYDYRYSPRLQVDIWNRATGV